MLFMFECMEYYHVRHTIALVHILHFFNNCGDPLIPPSYRDIMSIPNEALQKVAPGKPSPGFSFINHVIACPRD